MRIVPAAPRAGIATASRADGSEETMTASTLATEIADPEVHAAAVRHCAEAGVLLPTFAELRDPGTIPGDVLAQVAGTGPDAPDPANLFRVHWYNDARRRGLVDVPGHIELPPEITGTEARIVALLGERFPMIAAHKVLAAYACLVPRLVTGQFDPTAQRAVWPSTGNYCRGGVAIARILGCRSLAVLPEGMSCERFRWLEEWVADPADIVRTPGTESNVKEIYDECRVLAEDPGNVVINQFSEFGNYLAHYHCTGPAAARVFAHLAEERPGLKFAAFVAGTGSAGTLAAGDHLKEELGARIVAVEALECPTLMLNGYGEHNIQGIGDKHVPLIHNVMNTDAVVGVSDRSSDQLYLLFNTPRGRDYLARRRGVAQDAIDAFTSLGLSGIANVVAAIRVARHYELGADDVVMTVATDNAALYASQVTGTQQAEGSGALDDVACGEIFGEHLAALGDSRLLELTHEDRLRIFNLGYYTWVEQQGVSVADFDARKHQGFWRDLLDLLPRWDERIREFNSATGVHPASSSRSA